MQFETVRCLCVVWVVSVDHVISPGITLSVIHLKCVISAKDEHNCCSSFSLIKAFILNIKYRILMIIINI